MTDEQEKRFHDLAVKEALKTITTREVRELKRLQRIRHKEFDSHMEITDPGWRKREISFLRKCNRLLRKLEKLSAAR